MRPLQQLLAEAVDRHPDAVAVEDPSGSLTYDDLAAAARRVADELASRGPGVLAITGPRGIPLLTVLVGAVVADRPVVLVDPDLPALRREHMLQTAGAALVATATASGWSLADREQGDAPPRPASDHVFFTSGTTAAPKAVGGRWDSVAHFVAWQGTTFGIGVGDRVAQLTGLSFDVVLRDVFTTLTTGATLCVPSAGLVGGTSDLLDWLVSEQITVLHAVPSLAGRWLARAEAPQPPTPAVRLTFFAGEPLTGAITRPWSERFGASEIVNLYGPTETTLAKFFHRVDPSRPGLHPVGRPLPDTEARLVDDEIWIRTGAGTDGYVADPEAQAQAFTTEPDGSQWYRTGDVGRIDEDGLLWVLGRKDHQVKINGTRVEPSGVAAALGEHPEVTQAVVVVHHRSDGAPYLVGYYSSTGSADLSAWLDERLPAAHRPSVLVRLDAFPLTANGKVDRSALPEPGSAGPADGHAPPRSSLEATVLEVVRQVVPDVGDDVGADFFAHGGTSIEAAVLAARLVGATGRTWTMGDVYRLRTPRRFAAELDALPLADTAEIPRDPSPPARTGLSPQQRRYRNVYLPNQNRSWSNMVALFELPDGVGTDDVAAALRTIALRHDALRAHFSHDGEGGLVQHFREEVEIAVAEVDLGTVPADQQPLALERLRVAEANTRIDIETWPLFRATLVRRGERRTLLWNVHHMVSDGYSQGLLRAELTTLLTGAGDLPTLPISYRDYIRWAGAEGAERAAAQGAWWAQVFATPYRRPLLTTRDVGDDPAGGIAYQFPLPDHVVDAVATQCRLGSATPFTVVLTALFEVAYDLFEVDDLVIGTPASGRLRPELDALIGNFISLVAIRARRDEGDDLLARLALVRDRTVGAMDHQGYQYDQVMTDIGAPVDDDRFPLTTVFLSQVEIPAPLEETARLRELGCEVKFDLMGYLKHHDGSWWMELQTRRELMDQPLLEKVAADLLSRLLEGAGAL